MAKSKFRFKISTEDTDGNSSSENVSVNVGPAECTPPQVNYVFPSGVRARVGNNDNPIWGLSSSFASVFCQVDPTPRIDEGGDGTFTVQAYSDIGKYPNSPDSKFQETFSSFGGQLAATLLASETNYIEVTSGVGQPGFGLCTSGDLVGLRKAIVIDQNSFAEVGSATFDPISDRGARRLRGRGGGADREFLTAYNHDLSTDRVYTLSRLRPEERAAGSSVYLHPYHYCPFYENNTVSDILVYPHVIVQETGTQYPLTGIFTLSGTEVTGQYSDFTAEISGSENLIKFEDSDSSYIISGVTSATTMDIYDYGEAKYLTNQAAEINCYTLVSGTVAIQPDLAGCSSWDVFIDPDISSGDSLPSLSVTYQAQIQAQVPGGNISGVPNYNWEVLSGTVSPTWSGLVPGNNSSQLVTYEELVPKRIRVNVSGSGQPSCVHQYDTGDISLLEGVTAGTWYSRSIKEAVGSTGATVSNVYSSIVGNRSPGKYYHHNLSIMMPKKTRISSDLSSASGNTTVYIDPNEGSLDSWPDKGTFVAKGKLVDNGARQVYQKYTYTSKSVATNSLFNVQWRGAFAKKINPSEPDADQIGSGFSNTQGIQSRDQSRVDSGSEIWLQQVLPLPTSIVTNIATNRRTASLRDIGGFVSSANSLYCRFSRTYPGTGANDDFTEELYKIISVNVSNKTITLDKDIKSQIVAGSACVLQPYYDGDTRLIPSDVEDGNANFMNTAAWFSGKRPSQTSEAQVITTQGVTTNDGYLYVWNPMAKMLGDQDSRRRWTTHTIRVVGKLIVVGRDSQPSVVIEYSECLDPSTNFQEIRLEGAKINTDLGDPSITSITIDRNTLLLPYNDIDIRQLSNITFEPTDAGIEYCFNGGTSEDIGYSQAIIDQVYLTSSLDKTSTNIDMFRIPSITNYEEQLYPGWPRAGLRSQTPIYISTGPDISPATTTSQGGCVHYDTIVKVWDGKSYKSMAIKNIEIGSFVETPSGPKEVKDIISSKNGDTHIISTNDKQTLHCTKEHPISRIVEGDIKWTKASLIKRGDKIMTESGPKNVEVNLSVKLTGDTVHPFYDITVEDVHQFYANGILIHNKTITAPTS